VDADVLSEYIKETGYTNMARPDFKSWINLAAAYGHEITHRHYWINLSGFWKEKYGKNSHAPRVIREGLAHYWSAYYSGIGTGRLVILEKVMGSQKSFYNKYKMKP
jgi:hypothetical protein